MIHVCGCIQKGTIFHYFWALLLREEFKISVLSLLTNCQQTCVTYTIAVCTVKNFS